MAAAIDRLAAREGAARAGYAVTIESGWPAASAAFARAAARGAAGPFQQPDVLGAWYGAMARSPEIEPLLVSVTDRESGALALCLPLVRHRRGWLRVVAFADLDLFDYNAPILGPAAPRDATEAAQLWTALRRALPRADLLDFRKMPPEIAGRPNPLALLATAPSELNGNLVLVGEDYEAYTRGTLKRVVRKELERSLRVFERHPGARFVVASGADERRRVLAAIEEQQPIRMGQVGNTYRLDQPEAADFYRRLVEAHPDNASLSISALMAGEEIVAALIGLRERRRATLIRISSSADAAWTNCSPGRLIIERTMAHLHAQGVREFDFSVGNYDYKRRFGVEPLPLLDLTRPLSALGSLGVAARRARDWLRARPLLEDRLRRLAGRARLERQRP